MAKVNRYQLNVFVGSQSFIYRVDKPAEVQKITGLKDISAKSVAEFLTKLNNQVFDSEFAGSFKREDRAVKMRPKTRVSQAALEMSGIEQQPDYIGQLKAKLKLKTDKQILAKMAKLGVKTAKITPEAARVALMALLRGNK